MNEPSSYRVLVADDDRDTADSAAELLRFDGHEVLAVYDGRQAMETARTFHPQMVVLDINMPAMDGCEAAVAIRRESTDNALVLVAHTSMTQPDEIARFERAGFDHRISKPSLDWALGKLVAQCSRSSRSRSNA